MNKVTVLENHATSEFQLTNKNKTISSNNLLKSPNPDFVIVFSLKQSKDTGCLELFFKKIQQVHRLQIRTLRSSWFERDGRVFALISVPRAVLAKRAEQLQLLLPLVESSYKPTILDKIKHYFSPHLESGYYKAAYKERYDEHFTSYSDPFISSRIRGMLINDIMKDVDISEELKKGMPGNKEFLKDEYHGLRWLEEHGYIKDSFLLHSKVETRALGRKVLSKSSWVKSLSLTSLRDYFGEKIGFSFAWRSAWISNALGLPLILGFISMLYGLTLESLEDGAALGEGNNSLSSDNSSLLDDVFERYIEAMDNPTTPYYALVMCVWVALFSKIWARFKFIYSFKWGTLNFFLNSEREMVKFSNLAKRDTTIKFKVWIFIVLCTIVSILLPVVYSLLMIYIQAVLISFLSGIIDKDIADTSVNAVISLVNAILVIFAVNPFFEWTSMKLTSLEKHHFDSDFERTLSQRVFFSSFFNNNLRILIMLVTPRFKLYNIFNGNREDVVFCDVGKCTEAMSFQIFFFLLLEPIVNLGWYFFYITKQHLKPKRRNPSSRKTDDVRQLKFIESQYKLYPGPSFGEKFTTMHDMNARVAQYGFVVMYAASFPLAPLIAFVMEVLVRRTDMDRYLNRQRRSIPRQHEGVGSWQDIVEFVNMSAICTNVWIIAFRSRYGLEMIIDWKKYYPDDHQAMLSVVLISTLVLLTSCIRAISQHSTIPEKVKIFQRNEEKISSNILDKTAYD